MKNEKTEAVLYVASCSNLDPDYEEKKRIAGIQAEWRKRRDKKLIRFAMEEAVSIDDCESVWACDAKINELYELWMKRPEN